MEHHLDCLAPLEIYLQHGELKVMEVVAYGEDVVLRSSQVSRITTKFKLSSRRNQVTGPEGIWQACHNNRSVRYCQDIATILIPFFSFSF
jgi:hypothetical protein